MVVREAVVSRPEHVAIAHSARSSQKPKDQADRNSTVPRHTPIPPHQSTVSAAMGRCKSIPLGVPELARWLAGAGLALSPGHWFGREGAGFARMTIAAPRSHVAEAVNRLTAAVG